MRQIGLSYLAARLHRLAKSIPWNRFLGSKNVSKIRALVLGMSAVKEEAISLKLRFYYFLENNENQY